MQFSVLISVYINDNPLFLKMALESVYDQQILKPNEIVIVIDGDINKDNLDIILEFKSRAPVKIVKLKINSGLGTALHYGLKECSYEYVFRMDADDISISNRFLKQIEFFKRNPSVDILGGTIEEFKDNIGDLSVFRKVPKSHKEINNFLKWRSPFNHVTVGFKKSSILKCGSFLSMISFEDYYLWFRALKSGCITHNLEDVLVFVRGSDDMIGRRHGFTYYKRELKFFSIAYRERLIGLGNYFYFVMRAQLRLVPKFLLVKLYNRLLRN
ncbi:glycosyltransferase [Litoribacter populi]|uniref:glycosyltransferase n=1 Tax=Litoribacter populi TaxID=2598460 RepID=UPI00117F9E81|nr:glycosyltransferase [Litoribacter populi]